MLEGELYVPLYAPDVELSPKSEPLSYADPNHELIDWRKSDDASVGR